MELLNLKEINELIVKQKYIAESNKETLEKLANEVEELKSSINEQDIEDLKNFGIHLDSILALDIKQVQNNKESLVKLQNIVEDTIVQFRKVLTELLK